MNQADLDLIAKALAAGQRAVWTIKATYRGGATVDQAQRELLKIYAGMEALERLGGTMPKPSVRTVIDEAYDAVNAGTLKMTPLPPWPIPPLPPAPAPTAAPAPKPAAPSTTPKKPAPDLPAGGW